MITPSTRYRARGGCLTAFLAVNIVLAAIAFVVAVILMLPH